MKRHHVIVGHGDNPIPPPAWGAVEHIIWQFSTRLKKRDIPTHIINRRKWGALFGVLKLSLQGKADVVYCHAEKPVRLLVHLARWRKFLLIATTHNPVSPDNLDRSASKALRRSSYAPYQFVGRSDIEPLILALHPKANCKVQFNAVEVEEFRTKPEGNGKAICIGRIQERKRQNETALALEGSGIECDFVGPILEEVTISNELGTRLRGEWSREAIQNSLCDYSCLILLSQSERQPLVVVEALAAGIPVVLSRNSAWNIDRTKPFIFVVESDDQLANAVTRAIAVRDQYSVEIRKYAEDFFGYEVLVDDYLAQVEKWWTQEKVH